MPRLTQIMIVGVLLSIVSTAVWAESDVVRTVRDLYSRGEFLLVIDHAEVALSDTVELEIGDRIELRRLLGQAYVATGNMESAKTQFKKILALDPETEMDPLTTSPKIVSVFEQAKREYEEETRAGPPDTLPPLLTPARPAEGIWLVPALKSFLLPGLGQLGNGDQTKAVVFMSSEAVSLVGLAVSQVWYEDARRKYSENTDPSRMDYLYNEYNKWYLMRNGFAAAAAGVHILSSIDAIIGAYEKELKQREKTVGFMPIPGGIYAYVRF